MPVISSITASQDSSSHTPRHSNLVTSRLKFIWTVSCEILFQGSQMKYNFSRLRVILTLFSPPPPDLCIFIYSIWYFSGTGKIVIGCVPSPPSIILHDPNSTYWECYYNTETDKFLCETDAQTLASMLVIPCLIFYSS